MPTMFDDVEAKCPYFCANTSREIRCEGITDGCSTVLRFDSQKKKKLHRGVFCDAKFKNCEVYRMLEDKYEEE